MFRAHFSTESSRPSPSTTGDGRDARAPRTIFCRPWWCILLLLIPIVNIVIACVVWYNVAVNFGKGMGFAIGLILLSFIFIPILGFGAAQYIGSSGQGGQARYA